MKVTKISYTDDKGRQVEFEIDSRDKEKLKAALKEANTHADIGTLMVYEEPMSDKELEDIEIEILDWRGEA